MVKYWLIAISAVFGLAVCIEPTLGAGCAPETVSYDGAQLWTIKVSDENVERVVDSLEEKFGWFSLYSIELVVLKSIYLLISFKMPSSMR